MSQAEWEAWVKDVVKTGLRQSDLEILAGMLDYAASVNVLPRSYFSQTSAEITPIHMLLPQEREPGQEQTDE